MERYGEFDEELAEFGRKRRALDGAWALAHTLLIE
jgi:hypothetical protein